MSPDAAHELTLPTPRLRLAARAWGPEDAPPVLALHGWLDNAASFDRLAPLLPGLRIVALDHAGHGRSEHRGHGTYHFIDFVADAIAAAAALGWGRFAVLGHSLGAGVAALLAGTIPERITRLALLEGLGPLTEAPERAPARLRDALEAELRPERAPRRVLPDLDAAAAARARAGDLTLDAARLLAARGTEPCGDGLAWRADPRLRLPSRLRLTDDHLLAFLRAIACPTRVVLASRGWPMDPAALQARLAAIAGASVVHVDGGHHVHLDDPEPVAAALAGHLHA